jgi:hypothetical protein
MIVVLSMWGDISQRYLWIPQTYNAGKNNALPRHQGRLNHEGGEMPRKARKSFVNFANFLLFVVQALLT